MKNRAFWISAVLLLATAVHLAYVLFVPRLEMGRLMELASRGIGTNRFLVLDQEQAVSILGQQSHAFVQGICVIDAAAGPVYLRLDTPPTYWMANIYSRSGDNIYSLNDRQVSEVPFSVVVERQRPSLFSFAADDQALEDAAFRVRTSDTKSLLVVRVFVQDAAYRKRITRKLELSSCKTSAS